MANFRISTDLLVMLVAAVFYTVVGFVTGATFFIILCGSCLGLILIELIASRGHVKE